MKIWAIIFFLLPVLGSIYVGYHIWKILPFSPIVKWFAVSLLLAGFCLFVCNFIFGLDSYSLLVSKAMYNIGNSVIFIILYFFILFFVLDICSLFHLISPSFLKDSIIGSVVVFGVMFVVFLYANLHYHNKKSVVKEIDTNGRVEKPIKIVLMSDLHLGYHNTKKDLERWIEKINEESPDLVLIAGDIIDISVRPLLEENMAESFNLLKAPVYACLGNHEYYSGEPKAERFFEESKIKLLRDESIIPQGLKEIRIIGRDDKTNKKRKSLKQILQESSSEEIEENISIKVFKKPFTIVLDHQPSNLEEAELSGIDFQFSGHTHHGQMWPISWITNLLYECAYGSYTRSQTQYYISSGIGIWGGKFRVGTQSEYLVLKLK